MQNNNNKSELYTHIENSIPTLEQELLPGSPRLQLQEQEEIIQKGLSGFIEAGAALSRIKEDRLYKDNYFTYNDYCQIRWGFTPQYGNRLIKASVLIEVMKSETIVSVLPQSENQAKALLKSENPADDWRETQEITGKEQPTAKEIEVFIKERNKEVLKLTELDVNAIENDVIPIEVKARQEHPVARHWKTAPKAVVQFKNEKQIAIYRSAYAANRSTGIDQASIGKVCRHVNAHAGGYSWKFAHEIYGYKNKLIVDLEG